VLPGGGGGGGNVIDELRITTADGRLRSDPPEPESVPNLGAAVPSTVAYSYSKEVVEGSVLAVSAEMRAGARTALMPTPADAADAAALEAARRSDWDPVFRTAAPGGLVSAGGGGRDVTPDPRA